MNFWKCDSKALNPLFQYESTNRTHFSNMSQRIEPFFYFDSKNWTFFEYWLKELNFFEYDAKNWTFFLGYDAKIDPFLLNFDNKELNFLFKNDSMNWIWLKGLNLFFFNLTQRIELFVCFKIWLKRIELLNSFTNMAYSKSSTHLNLFIWLNELDLFYMTLRIEPYWIITQRIESSFSWLKELNPLKRLNELNIFVIQRIVLSLLNVIQRIESFLLNVTQRIESLLKNMKNSLIWSKERIEILWYDTKDWIFWYDSQNLTLST